jgi:anti-sigma regulatory factor (Ser/Thr protein kinase)
MAVCARAIYPAEPSAVAAARHEVRRRLDDAGLAHAAPLACLLTSELVTNAVCHARTSLTLTVDWDAERILVEVEDRDDGEPVVAPEPREEPGGLGLLIVAEMASRWGYRTRTGCSGGKVVWFELAANAFRPASRLAAS